MSSPSEAMDVEEEGEENEDDPTKGKKKKGKKPRQASGDATTEVDGGIIEDDLLELLGEVAPPPSAPSSDDEEEDFEESEFESSCEEEEGDEGWKEDDVSIFSADAEERRYVVGSESFTHLKNPGLRHAYDLVVKVKEEEKTCGGNLMNEQNDYKKLCEELGVIPCSKFLRNIHNDVMDLSFMGLNQKGVLAVVKSLLENSYVKTLLLRGNDCGGEAGEAIAELLENNYLISHLDLARTNIIKSMKRICEALRNNVTVLVLDISRNDLTDNEMRPFSLVLQDGVLRELYMSRNYIMDEGLNHLSKGFGENTTLEILDLAYNRFWGEKDSLPFFSQAAQHEALRRLDLQGNSIKDPAGKAIAKTMTGKKCNLEYLNVSFNLLTQATCADFGKCLAQSRTVDTLIAGPNRWNLGPLTQGYLANMINPLTGGKANPALKLLDLCYITPIQAEFMKPLKTLAKNKPDLKIIHGEPFGFNEGTRPDMHALLIRRLNVICENFETPLSMLINELRTEPATLKPKLFKKFIKSCNLYKDKKMTKELMKNFPANGGLEVDCKAIIAAYDKEYRKTSAKGNEEIDGEGMDVGGVSVSTKHMSQLLKW